jgi:hypothetical protein
VVAAQLKLRTGNANALPTSPNQGPGHITAQTELRPGELLVLGQSSLPDKGGTDRQLYYIVRATL